MLAIGSLLRSTAVALVGANARPELLLDPQTTTGSRFQPEMTGMPTVVVKSVRGSVPLHSI